MADEKMKLGIATCFFENKGYANYIASSNATFSWLSSLGVPCVQIQRKGDAWVHRAKNGMIAQFLQTDCTHFILIDSDVSWEIEGFKRLLMADVDLVGGIYPLKQDPETYWAPMLTRDGQPIIDPKTGLMEMEAIPGGFWKVTRRCLERMWEAYEVLGYEEPDGMQVVELFKDAVIARRFRSEDTIFCQRWRALGGKVWCVPDINFAHAGFKEWQGNFGKYLFAKTGE